MKTQEEKENLIYENSLRTCVYVSGNCKRDSKITVKCLIHDLEFEIGYDTIRKTTYPHHICPECKRLDKNGTVKIPCDYCGKEFVTRKSHYNRFAYHFCCRTCKDKAQRVSSGNKFSSMRPPHYGDEDISIYNYRTYALENYEHKCSVCGWNEDIDVLEVHHIDSNRANNNLDNLIVLCPNCHTKITIGKYELLGRNQIIKKGI